MSGIAILNENQNIVEQGSLRYEIILSGLSILDTIGN